MTFYFDREAEEEMDKAAAYYEGCRRGLGADFIEEVYAALGMILRYPQGWPIASPRGRSCRMRRFPYAVIYQIEGEALRLIAVANLNRKPGYWRDRLEDEE